MCSGQISKIVSALALILSTATTSLAEDLRDIHLDVIPRTDTERAQVAELTAQTKSFRAPEAFEHLPGGATTSVADADRNAFSQPSANLSFEQELDFRDGNNLFRQTWVASPSAFEASDGLGPLFNARSCQDCHLRDGRGRPPEGSDDQAVSLFLRVSVPGGDEISEIKDYIATTPEPTYGKQLQGFAVTGQRGEAWLAISYQRIEVRLSDGERAYLRQPTYNLDQLAYGPWRKDATFSPRVAPQMIGLGLLEAIPAKYILSAVDEEDADGDGVSGRANIVWSREFNQPMLGRFGLKAGTPTVSQQSGDAFSTDMGISNPLFPDPWGDCSRAQEECRLTPHGNRGEANTEIDENGMDFVSFYSRNLAVPIRRNFDNAEVLRGKEIFYSIGCTACHTPKFVTHRLNNRPEHSDQLIWPYSDLLLHDMGEGLADHRPEARATGREWRTPPLWGIGLTQTVSGHTNFLHDGRARNLLEAILWHGGEAQSAKQRAVSMPKVDRKALIRFLQSL